MISTSKSIVAARHYASAIGVLITLLAFILRLHRIDAQSLWADEGASAFLALASFPQIASSAAGDVHPPLYYFLLHLEVLAAGNSEFSLRFLSAVFGTLTVAVSYRFASQLFGRSTGLLASLLLSLSALGVYYSQEARMYALLSLLGLISTLFFSRWLNKTVVARATLSPVVAGYVISTVLTLYTQYTAVAIPLFQNVVLLATQGLRDRRLIPRWIGIQLIVIALYAPWLVVARDSFSRVPYGGHQMSGLNLAVRMLGDLLAGSTYKMTLPLLTVPLVFCLLGVARKRWFHSGSFDANPTGVHGQLLIAAYALVMPTVLLVSNYSRPEYSAKLLLLSLPPFAILMALGAERLAAIVDDTIYQVRQRLHSSGFSLMDRFAKRLGRLISTALVASIAIPNIASLVNYYYDAQYARDDYRAIAKRIETLGLPGDAIVLDSAGLREIFSYYYRGKLPYYGIPEPGHTADQMLASLADIASSHARLWVIVWASPREYPDRLWRWLGENCYKAEDRWVGSVRFAVYGTQQVTPVAQSRNAEVLFGDAIRLVSYSLVSPADSGDGMVRLNLNLETLEEPKERYVVFVHMVDSEGYVWGQVDGEPEGGTSPTSAWRRGDIHDDRKGILLRPGTPPGEYRIIAGIYSLANGQRLPARKGDRFLGGDTFEVGSFELRRPWLASEPSLFTPSVRLGPGEGDGLRLIGFDFSQPKGELRPGDTVHLVLYWRAVGKPKDATAVFRLAGRAGESYTLTTSRSVSSGGQAGSSLPVESIMPGDTVVQQLALMIPDRAKGGSYSLWLEPKEDPSHQSSGQGLRVPEESMFVGKVDVRADRNFKTPRPTHPLTANFGNEMELLGYELRDSGGSLVSEEPIVSPGDNLDVTMYWRALTEIGRSYTVFVHIVDMQNQQMAQSDGPPKSGLYPTTHWASGEVVADTHKLKLPPNVPEGRYRIRIGLYELASMKRLPLLDLPNGAYADAVELGLLTIGQPTSK